MPLPEPRKGTSVGFHVYPTVMDEGTLGEPEAIVWSSIRHLCSRDVAESVAEAHGIIGKRDRTAIGRNLKVYLQQASEFYEAGRSAKPNTAPLIYYYSFLNLAKALCELRRPDFHERPECYRHGISWKPNTRKIADPGRETVSITTRGVWHALWEALVEAPCPAPNPTRLKIESLFSYCPEISVEAQQALGAPMRLIDLENPDVLYDPARAEAWLKFSVSRDDLRIFAFSAPSLIAQVRTLRSGYVEVRGADRQFRTFETALPITIRRRQTALEALRTDILGLNAFTHLEREKKLHYFFPVEAPLPFRVPQVMVYYTILFWLGSLVRYDPHSVYSLMDSRFWMLIDGFMSQSRLWLLELFEWALYRAETTLWVSR